MAWTAWRSRVVLGETGLPHIRAELDTTLPVTGFAMLGDPQKFMATVPGLLRNTEVLEKAAGGRGLITIVPERDGIVRRVPMILMAQVMREFGIERKDIHDGLAKVKDVPSVIFDKATFDPVTRRVAGAQSVDLVVKGGKFVLYEGGAAVR